MGRGIEVRRLELSAGELRQQASRCGEGRVACCVLALAHVLEGASRAAAASACGMDRQTLRDWVLRYNSDGVTALSDAWGDGRPCRLTEGQQATLRAIILTGPDPVVTGVSTWRVVDLCGIVRERFGISYSESGLAKLLHALDLSWQTPRPQHPESDAAGQAAFKKSSGRCSTGSLSSSRRRSGWKSGSSMKRELARKAG